MGPENFDMEKVNNIAMLAGSKVMEVYNEGDKNVKFKKDNSPITKADMVSQDTIIKELSKEFADIPILSEEKADVPFEERKGWEYYWLVDPLDGTKEFIARNGEFTVNIALIHKNRPVLGVIFAPALNLLYFAQESKGSFKKYMNGEAEPIHVNRNVEDKTIVVRSRSHNSKEDEEFISYLGSVEEIQAGSSLKLCYVAEGKADIYVRMGTTMEWDIAAGQCIVENSGGKVLDWEGDSLKYNKRSLKNSGFYCICGDETALRKTREYFSNFPLPSPL